MGEKWIATLKVEFEMHDDRPEGMAKMVLRREVAESRDNIERGLGLGPKSLRVSLCSRILR